MSSSINNISISGFKSIRSLENFKLGQINILIGANGAGKSNFVSFFSFLHKLVSQNLAFSVNKEGGADSHLYLGPKVTPKINADVWFGQNGYSFTLEPTVDNRLIFASEKIHFIGDNQVARVIGTGQSESRLLDEFKGDYNKKIVAYIVESVVDWVVYHFHDTSGSAPMRRVCSVRDNSRFRRDGQNLAAFLLRLRDESPDSYSMIRSTVQLVAPFFDDFILRPQQSNGDSLVQLEWKQKNSDYPFHAGQLSDGTLRFIALATALLQPTPPSTILIDEPELGLHPFALNILTALINSASHKAQIIISTQSPNLLNAFQPEDIIVVDRHGAESSFKRLNESELSTWLKDDYTLGELWQKSVYGGGPSSE